MDARTQTTEQMRTPAYVSFKSFTSFVADQKEHGLPSRIDRSVLTKFSGGVGNQLISGLKFLGLIDEDQSAGPELNTLVDAYGTEEWSPELEKLLKRAYAPVLACDLANATPAQFHEAFKNSYQAATDVMRKCEAFFLNAAQAAKIPINSRIVKHRAPRTGSGRKRTNGSSNSAPGGDRSQTQQKNKVDLPETPARTARTPYEVLMHDIFDPIEMKPGSDEEKAVFTLARFLKTKEVGS